MNGIINFSKPTGMTSAKALYRVRSITGERKSGHAGTLDPGASGVLVICIGKATKLVELIMDQPKVYRATARLDVTSESFDSDRPLIPVDVPAPPTPTDVQQAFRSFEGRIQQVPPIISAIKIGGRPAYKRARDGSLSEPRPLGSAPVVRKSPPALVRESLLAPNPRPSESGPRCDHPLELKPRPVDVYWLYVHSYAWPELDFEMCCGRGTYVRALIRDVGNALGTGGCLTSLVRTRVGPFTLDCAHTFDDLREAGESKAYLVDLPRAGALLDPKARSIPTRVNPDHATRAK